MSHPLDRAAANAALGQEDPREIAKWAKRYARSRTIPFLVQWVFIVALVMVIGSLSYVTLEAYYANRTTLMWICIVGIGVMMVALMWFSMARWGGEQIWRISQWVYGREGYAAYEGGDEPDRMRHTRWIALVGAGLVLYHMAGAVLVALRYVPMPYIQPLSALYMAPFLAVMIVSQRLGFWAWVWPLLYALHAMLLVAGAPIHFPGKVQFLDVLVPIFGYGLLSILIGHLYSRYAFRRLKQLARAGLAESEETQDEDPTPEDPE
jgi:hypothetical protein